MRYAHSWILIGLREKIRTNENIRMKFKVEKRFFGIYFDGIGSVNTKLQQLNQLDFSFFVRRMAEKTLSLVQAQTIRT